MSCDIHFVIERKAQEGGWIGVYSTCFTPAFASRALYGAWLGTDAEDRPEAPDSYKSLPVMDSRNYRFFSKLAGVRGDDPGIAHKGAPPDLSVLATEALNSWGSDAHSTGYCSLGEFANAYADASEPLTLHLSTTALKNPNRYVPLTAEEVLFGDYHTDEHAEYRVVFWFDN